MTDYIKLIEDEIFSYLPKDELTEKVLIDSMRYSLEAGGKRLRPMLVLLFAKACGGKETDALPFASAIEMIHTYSLIHDDLPCMDNDDLRRGKPSNHKVFGEDIALLAGDALLTLAFSVVLSERAVSLVGYEKSAKCGRVLSECAGMTGMVGGQVIDLISENVKVSIETINEMHLKKTGALIKCACMMGAIVAGAEEETVYLAEKFGIYLGLAFQIKDDILDVTGSEEALGKPIGSDVDNNKSTFVTLLGLEKCRSLVKEYTEKAIAVLDNFKGDSSELKAIAQKMLERKN
jgi:geranylgeranyl diphosphate synthase type II